MAINITGGDIYASVEGSNASPAIGGGVVAGTKGMYGGDISITGGYIEASSESGPGIGAGGTNAATGTLTLDWSDTDDPYNGRPEIKSSSYRLESVVYKSDTDGSSGTRAFALKADPNTPLSTSDILGYTDTATTIIPSYTGIIYLDVSVDPDTHKVSTFARSLAAGDYEILNTSSLGSEGETKWYAVTSDTVFSSRMTISGDVGLILCNDTELTASGGIEVPEESKLFIYQQPEKNGEAAGTLTAKAVDGTGNAGIGGNDLKISGDITINGGTVNACGAKAQADNTGSAAIGGGRDKPCKSITINYGTVIANNNSGGYNHVRGAAIGCGGSNSGSYNKNNTGIVEINGGNITAKGGCCAAGIGGGQRYTGGTIKIYGGTISATSNYHSNGRSGGAGIGGGWNGHAGNIFIYGGEITAAGTRFDNAFGAGIGCGCSQEGGSIYISGGTIRATSVDTKRGIGGGSNTPSTTINLDWTRGTFDSTEITADAYAGTVNFVKPYILKNERVTARRSNMDGVTIIPGIALSGVMTEGRKYEDGDFTNDDTSITIPANSGFTT